jgi:plasmid stabilization system protein ParE
MRVTWDRQAKDDTTHIINCYAEDAGVNLTDEQMG